MARKVSIKMLADQLGLSNYAVSRALSGKSGVSPATRRRVVDLARSLGYQHADLGEAPQAAEPEQAASFVLICMNSINENDPFYWQRLLNGLMQGCAQRGLQHVIVTPDPAAAAVAESPREAIAPHVDWSRCGGIAIMGAFPHDMIQLMTRTGRPFVLVDHADPLLVCDKVNNDNIEAGMTIARYMLSQSCRRIAFLRDDDWSVSFADRRTGARLAFDSIRPPDAVLEDWRIDYADERWPDRLHEKLAALGEEERPDGWIGANDDIAIRWMRKLQGEGWRVPEQCRIAGIDNVEAAVLVSPQLTTVNLCKEELGHRAVEALLRRMERPGAPVEKIQLSTNLVVRSST